MDKKLFRSSTDKMLGGVCGGIAAYSGIDATLVRLLTAAAVLLTGVGPVFYLLAWVLIPAEDGTLHARKMMQQAESMVREQRAKNTSAPARPDTTYGQPYGDQH